MKLKEFIARLNTRVEDCPELLELDCFFTDDQCAHFEVSGNVFQEIVDEWPQEYCISEATSAKSFARIC